MTDYFFDTYALVAAFEESDAYVPYLDATVVCNSLNLLEFHYVLLRMGLSTVANDIIASFAENVEKETIEDICAASRLKHRKKKSKAILCRLPGIRYGKAPWYCVPNW